MCLPNIKCLKNLVVAKRASKDMLSKLSHVRQTMLVSFARPLGSFLKKQLMTNSDYVSRYTLGPQKVFVRKQFFLCSAQYLSPLQRLSQSVRFSVSGLLLGIAKG